MDVLSRYLGWGRVPTLLPLHRYMRINHSRNGVKETEVNWGRLRIFDLENIQLLLGVETLVGVLSRFSHASPKKIRSRPVHVQCQYTLLKICAEMNKERFQNGVRENHPSPQPGEPSKKERSQYSWWKLVSIEFYAMVVEREYQILQIIYRAVFGKLLDVLPVISGQLINNRARKPFRTGQIFWIHFSVMVVVGSLLPYFRLRSLFQRRLETRLIHVSSMIGNSE